MPARRAWTRAPLRSLSPVFGRPEASGRRQARARFGVIKRHMYVLAVPDLSRSGAFYREVLGFEVRELAPGWLTYAKDGCQIMAGECRDAIPPRELGDHSYFGYLVVDDVDEYHQRAVAGGTEIVKPLRDEPWGMREFGLRTVDGHRIMIGSERREADERGGRTRG